jgi:hypothetical protein
MKINQEEEQGYDPMDTDIPRSSLDAPMYRGHFPLGELGLGSYTPSNSKKVSKLNSFRLDKESGKIIKHKIRKLPVIGVAPLSLTMEQEVVENIKYDPLSISSVGLAFTHSSKQKLRSLMQEVEEYKEKIRSLEEDIRFYKEDKTNI